MVIMFLVLILLGIGVAVGIGLLLKKQVKEINPAEVIRRIEEHQANDWKRKFSSAITESTDREKM